MKSKQNPSNSTADQGKSKLTGFSKVLHGFVPNTIVTKLSGVLDAHQDRFNLLMAVCHDCYRGIVMSEVFGVFLGPGNEPYTAAVFAMAKIINGFIARAKAKTESCQAEVSEQSTPCSQSNQKNYHLSEIDTGSLALNKITKGIRLAYGEKYLDDGSGVLVFNWVIYITCQQ